MPLTYRIGDATLPPERPAIIAHVCNDVGAWGAGFTGAISRRWPDVGRNFRTVGPVPLGGVSWASVPGGIDIANMVAQRGIGRGLRRLDDGALKACLRIVAHDALAEGASVHMPRIGCGLAGATWEEVEPIVRACLVDRGVDVFVYDLGATP